MSFGSPCGAPASTQRTMVSTCSSVSDRSFLNFWMPTLRSICHGGIWRSADARLDRLGPRPRFGVGHQRHRRHRIGPMTRLAFLLEDRRDILGKRRSLRGVGGGGRAGQHQRHAHRQRANCHIPRCPNVTSHHVSCSLCMHCSSILLASDGHFHVRIGPAALKPAAALAGLVVGLHPQHVVARPRRRSRWR